MSITTNHNEGELVAGQMLGRYELLMPIATGGMGTVWAARLKGSRGFRKLVAIKTMLRSVETADSEQMLLREATLASQIHHPNVAETLELGEQDGTLYLVMELVSGESLSFILREAQRRGGVPFPIAINLVGQICRGLAAAHDLRDDDGQRIGLIHRDISPPNVLVTDSGTVKIVDFGVATTSSSATYGSGEIKGKISYLAPEQLRGEPLDERVDIFTTGILLYLLTVGRHPFRASSEAATVGRILSELPAAPPSSVVEDYPEALEAVVIRALEKRRDQRFESALALLEALQRAWPDAFGPRADEAVCAYVRELTKERAAERRSTLRVAEELSEKSGPRHSLRSMSAVVASLPSPPRSKRRSARLGVLALWVGLGSAAAAAAAAVPTYLNLQRSSEPAPAAVMPAAPRATAPAAVPVEPAREVPAPVAVEPPASVAPSATSEAVPVVDALAAPEPRIERRRSSHVDSSSEQTPAAPVVANASTESAFSRAVPEAGVDPASLMPAALPRLEPAIVTKPAVAVLSPSRAEHALPAAPRVVSSKVGHGLLRIDPNASAYRVRLPGALDREGVAFKATVKICVNESGRVSSVNVMRSASPAIDARLREVLLNWRYRPLVDSGRKTPFCYTLLYEILP